MELAISAANARSAAFWTARGIGISYAFANPLLGSRSVLFVRGISVFRSLVNNESLFYNAACRATMNVVYSKMKVSCSLRSRIKRLLMLASVLTKIDFPVKN